MDKEKRSIAWYEEHFSATEIIWIWACKRCGCLVEMDFMIIHGEKCAPAPQSECRHCGSMVEDSLMLLHAQLCGRENG